ncbi:hypothetical protein [Nitratireductor sp. GCM10026969]|uniref:hypothetical protein n=1 Tax=Nitratireductor sp. GCM10026969 TaxID=3252645 RepID=UPI0036145D1C
MIAANGYRQPMTEERTMPSRSIGFTTLSVLFALAMVAPASAQEATLPGNAATLREIHGD